MNRRRFLLQSLGTSLALPGLPSLMAKSVGGNSAVQAVKGAGAGAQRFVAIGNLLGYQVKSLFPTTTGRNYEKTTLLEPLWENRSHMTVFKGLDHGVKGGHFAVHSFLSGVLNSEAQNRPDGNVSIDQYLADEVGFETRFPSLTVGSEGGIHGGCQIAWTKSGVRVPPITGPAELFERLFISDSKERQARRVQENQVQASILDSVLEDANRLSRQVNKEDKDKLDEYLTSVRDVEKRLELRKRWASQPKPKAPFEKPANRNPVQDLPMLYELIALALQTDSTRIATLEIGDQIAHINDKQGKPPTISCRRIWALISPTTASPTTAMIRRPSPTSSRWRNIRCCTLANSSPASPKCRMARSRCSTPPPCFSAAA